MTLIPSTYQGNLTPVTVPARSTIEQTFAVIGISLSETVVAVTPPASQPGLTLVGFRIVGPNTVVAMFNNETSQPITPTASSPYTIVTSYSVPDPPASPVLLCHCDGTAGSTAFVDSSASAHVMTPTFTTISANAKFGTGSASIPDSTGRIVISGTLTDFNFGAGQFTIEAWVYPTSLSGTSSNILAQFSGGGPNDGFMFAIDATRMRFYYTIDGINPVALTTSVTMPTNTWSHVAVDRDAAGRMRHYLNGVVINSSTIAATFFPSTLNAQMGHSVYAFSGYIDELRVIKGRAMYGGAFIPSPIPFGA